MKHICLAALVLLAPACLENDEEIEVHPDGSLDVKLSARGGISDLADGYPIPLAAPWQLASEDARRWTLQVGPDTGSVAVRKRAAEVAWPSAKTSKDDKEPQAELAVTGRFASVDELPRLYAPENEPYRSAHLARDTSLKIEDRPNGRVFTFERVYHGFDRARIDPLPKDELPKDLEQKLEQHTLSDAERAQIVTLVTAGHERASEALTRDALLGLFTRGDGGLAPGALDGVIAEMRAASNALVTRARIEQLLALVATNDDAAGKTLEELEQDWRATLRTTLASALLNRRVPEATRNAALFALEWQFTAFDHYDDLGDETFVLSVNLPGTIVGGNFTSVADGVARFEFKGNALQGKDVVLRAVAVLE